MAKLVLAYPDKPEYSDMLKFRCPACQTDHIISIGPKSYWVSRWQFNGDFNNPTFSPSLAVTSSDKSGRTMCHSFIRDGKIQFLSDCTHNLKNKTVYIPDYEF